MGNSAFTQIFLRGGKGCRWLTRACCNSLQNNVIHYFKKLRRNGIKSYIYSDAKTCLNSMHKFSIMHIYKKFLKMLYMYGFQVVLVPK